LTKPVNKISSIIIAKNEEQNISRCIQSQLDCIDEIIVIIDKESSDKTLEIVKSYPRVVYDVVEWLGYSATKEYAVKKATNEWILWIDADEALTKELIIELQNFKFKHPDKAAYKIARRAYFLGKWIKHCGWYPGYVVRLFNKNLGKFSNNSVHEHLIINGEVGFLKSDLEHYTDPSISHYFEKFNKYTTLAAFELNKKNIKVKISDIIFRPMFLFIKMYFFRLGFLDGLYGLILSVFSASYVFTKYCKLWELNRDKNISKVKKIK
jgi:glycosyltransferase involved in cell wall biosynthesis